MRDTLDKSPENGTMPGSIVELLRSLSLDVKYYTSLDWMGMGIMSPEEIKEFCMVVNSSYDDSSSGNVLDPNAVSKSIKFFNSNAGRKVIRKWDGRSIEGVFQEAINEKVL